MRDLETRMLLGHCLETVTPKTELSRRFEVSCRTIHHWLTLLGSGVKRL